MVGHNLKSKTNADPCKRVPAGNIFWLRCTKAKYKLYYMELIAVVHTKVLSIESVLKYNLDETRIYFLDEDEDQIDEVINNLPWTQCAIVTITPKTTDA